MMTEKRTRRLRDRFIIIKKQFGYDVSCTVMGCLWHRVGERVHRRALDAGYAHARTHD